MSNIVPLWIGSKNRPVLHLHLLHHFYICWQPLHAAQLILREPSCRLVFVQRQAATFNMTPIAMHRQSKFRIIILHRTQELIHTDLRFQFFLYFTLQRFLGRLPSLNFPATSICFICNIRMANRQNEVLHSSIISLKEFPQPFHFPVQQLF